MCGVHAKCHGKYALKSGALHVIYMYMLKKSIHMVGMTI